MHKIFNKFIIGIIFSLSAMFIFVNHAEAGIVTVLANGQNPLTVTSGTEVTITWNASSWATSCVNSFNSSTNVTGSYTYTATLTKTFTVTCNSTVFVCPSYTLDSVCPPSPGLNCSPGYTPLCFSGGGTTCFQTSCAPGGGCNPVEDPFHCEAQAT